MKHLAVLSLAFLALAACTPDADQRSVQTRSLNSGVTSSNGGGQFMLHNQPNVGITGGSATTTGVRGQAVSP